jgi:hypothetical protein
MADKKITQLDALASVTADDVFLVVDDPSGTPTSKKVTAANLATYTSTGLATTASLSVYAPLASPTFTGTVAGISKTMVGLGDVDNTSDANKPVSSATQTALNLKADLASPTFTGTPAAPTAAVGTSTTQVATTAFVMNSSDDDQFVLAAAIFTS